jgi:hypothetical protein
MLDDHPRAGGENFYLHNPDISTLIGGDRRFRECCVSVNDSPLTFCHGIVMILQHIPAFIEILGSWFRPVSKI